MLFKKGYNKNKARLEIKQRFIQKEMNYYYIVIVLFILERILFPYKTIKIFHKISKIVLMVCNVYEEQELLE